jgi:uncharacterized protein
VPRDTQPTGPDRTLTVVWSQDPMLRRTAFERWFVRNGRRLLLVVVAVIGYVSCVGVSGALLAEQLLRPPRRAFAPADEARARAVAQRTGSRLSGERLWGADNAVLRAWWFVPQEKARGTVIVLHGQADNRAAMLGLTELLLTERYRVLAPDARAHGTSGGALATYGLLERDDLRGWAGWAEQRSPDQCLFGAGASMGAAILIETLPDAAFCAAVADSAFADLAQLAVFRIGSALRVPRALHSVVAAPVVSAAMWYARVRHGVALSAASPVQRLARSRVPVLVIHGTGDREIPASDARTLAAANPRVVTVWMVEGAGHTRAWATAPREYPARVARFLAQHQ